MTLVAPKTILISPAGVRQGQVALAFAAAPRPFPAALEDPLDDLLEPGPRKRRRLTHLSPEDRMLRRKLKNRVAAQTARDRKKLHMTELEQVVADLEAENKRLQRENSSLRNVTGNLSKENSNLKEKLGLSASEGGVSTEAESVSESAVLCTPLQKETARTLFLWITHLMMLFLTSRTTSCSVSSSKSQTPSLRTIRRLLSTTTPQQRQHILQQIQRSSPKWWGPQQKSWNPSKN